MPGIPRKTKKKDRKDVKRNERKFPSFQLLFDSKKLTKNGAKDHIKLDSELRYAASLSTLISFLRIFNICSSNEDSHAYNFNTFIPLSTSFINFTLSSLCFICLICRVLTLFVINIFIGISINKTAKPASTAGPNMSHKKYNARTICNGADQITFMYAVKSINLCASTDIKFTISPTVDSFLAELDIRNAFR